MNFPTVLSPWYVVQKFRTLSHLGEMYYYTAVEDADEDAFDEKPEKAMLFMSLTAAARVAASEGAEVRVLTTKDEAKEFRRE